MEDPEVRDLNLTSYQMSVIVATTLDFIRESYKSKIDEESEMRQLELSLKLMCMSI